jgi:MSHA pilin protein MshA
MFDIKGPTMLNKAKGFTLIELIVVILILAILSAIALPRLTNLQKDARIAKLNASRGSVAAAAALTHATILARSNVADAAACPGGGGTANNISNTAATGTLCTEAGVVNMAFAYPRVTALGTAGLLSAAGLTIMFNPLVVADLTAEGYVYGAAGTTATIQILGSTNPATCQFTYTEPAAVNTAPVISAVLTAGC